MSLISDLLYETQLYNSCYLVANVSAVVTGLRRRAAINHTNSLGALATHPSLSPKILTSIAKYTLSKTSSNSNTVTFHMPNTIMCTGLSTAPVVARPQSHQMLCQKIDFDQKKSPPPPNQVFCDHHDCLWLQTCSEDMHKSIHNAAGILI